MKNLKLISILIVLTLSVCLMVGCNTKSDKPSAKDTTSADSTVETEEGGADATDVESTGENATSGNTEGNGEATTNGSTNSGEDES